MSQILLQVQDLLTIGFLVAGLAVISPWLILLLAIAVVPSFLTEVYYNRSSYSLSRSWTPERRELDYLRYIGASDTTAKEIKIFGLSDFLTSRFGTLAHQYYLANRSLSVRRTLWGSIFNAFGIGAYYAAYVFIIRDTAYGPQTIGDLTFLAGSFMRLRVLLQGMLSRFSGIAQSALYLQDLFDFLEIKPEIESPESPADFPHPIREGFVFENVGFQYPGTERWAVRGLSFRLQAGEKLALVGENGAGKTTLVKLISRLYDPTEGRILLDGRDLKEYSIKDLRDAIGIIFQDFVRFHLAARENIGVGRVEELEDHERIEKAAQKSLADTVVAKLEDGYDQMLGKRFDRGVELSGGEWQKVALARAYMREAQLLVLDEPTAALDARAEYEVFERFAELTRGKSAVLISHRFSTVRMADRILVLKGGELEEIGSHEELVAKDGLYAELFRLQAQGYV
jgi:ATP-binding cassette subfamily B protein